MNHHINASHLADIFEVSINTIHNWRREGMPYYRIGRVIRFDYDEVSQWFAQFKCGSYEKDKIKKVYSA